MGVTRVQATVQNEGIQEELDFLVDGGATYTVVPEPTWRKLQLEPIDEIDATLVDGIIVTRKLSETRITLNEKTRTVQVILGEENDKALIGVLTLESFGLMINPYNRELIPMELMM